MEAVYRESVTVSVPLSGPSIRCLSTLMSALTASIGMALVAAPIVLLLSQFKKDPQEKMYIPLLKRILSIMGCSSFKWRLRMDLVSSLSLHNQIQILKFGRR